MRGKAPTRDRLSIVQRITPAHAGKSSQSPCCCSRTRDHPRACGEKMDTSEPIRAEKGSPPRMRGKGPKRSNAIFGSRITPAHAGKSHAVVRYAWRSGDHPHACGEKPKSQEESLQMQGSPPRMRGKGRRFPFVNRILRITPAHAGKSPFQAECTASKKDHPRACGEKFRKG